MYIEEANDYSRSYYTYDSVFKREKIVQETNVNGKLDAGEYIRLYAQNVEYFYNYNSKQCTKNTTWKQICKQKHVFGYNISHIFDPRKEKF